MKIKLIFFLFIIGITTYAQVKVEGTVKDSNGETLPGVSIIEKGTTTGVTTDMDGKYSIKVKDDKSVLVFTFVGLTTIEEVVGNRTSISPTMSENAEMLDDVIVTALGIKKSEKSLGYSATKVSGSDAIMAGNPNPIDGLQGKVAGVQVIKSSGTPGASSKILIRGNATFGNNQPLIVVDGIPIDNSTNTSYSNNVGGVDQSNRAIDINPEDIESVTVLKGAAATALYGSRAGNGVIVYTTKRAKAGTNGKIFGSFSAGVNFTNAVNLHKKQQKYGYTVYDPAHPEIASSMSWGDEIKDSPIQNMDEFFRTGVAQDYNLSLFGGTDKTLVRGSIGYNNSQGIIPNSYFKRTSVRLTASHQLTSRLKLDGSVNMVNSGGNRPQKGSNLSGVMLSLYRTPINYSIKDAYENSNEGNENYSFWYDNPYYSAQNNTYIDNVWRTMGYGSLTADLTKKENPFFNSLNLMYRLGGDYYSDTRKGQSPIGSNATDDKQGMIVDYSATFCEINNDIILTGSKQMEKFSVDFTIGGNMRSLKDQYQLTEGYGLIEKDFYNIMNAQTIKNDQYTTLVNENALYADITMGYKRMVFLGITGRNEWSSKYAQGKNNYFFPGANLAFIFTELGEDGKFGPLTFGKVRASIGRTGIAPSPWRYRNYTYPTQVQDGYSDGNSTDLNGVNLTNWDWVMANSNLSPEILTGKEVGIDLRFWEGRLTVDFAYYHQTTSDLLINVPVSSATGFEANYMNIGEMVNKGIELAIGGDIIKKKNLVWNSTFNYGKNTNTVTKLAEGVDEISLNGGFTSISSYAKVGEEFGVMYSEVWERNSNGDILIDDDGYAIFAAKKEKVGNPYPAFTMGWRNTVTYKNWSFMVFLDGFFGGDVYNGTKSMMNYRGIGIETEDRDGEIAIEGVNANTGEKNDVKISKQDYWMYYKGIAGAAEEAVEHVNYAKLREVAISYRLNLDKSKYLLNDLTFTAIGTNLFTISNYSDGDPETSLTGAGSNTQGFDYFNSPNVRGFMFKIATHF